MSTNLCYKDTVALQITKQAGELNYEQSKYNFRKMS